MEGGAAELERDLFARGKQVLGKTAGGMVVKLLRAKGGSVAKARAAIEEASEKHDPREYIARVIGRSGVKVTVDELRPAATPGKVYVPFEERDAWDIYGRSVGKTYPRDSKGGWWFPSRQPPTQATA